VVSGFSRTRKAAFDRQTTETQIRGELTVDGGGRYDVSTGIRFFDHMLELFTRHGGFDLTLKATGDLDVDQHHTVEDVGIVLGETVLKALGDRKGINRAGYFVMPMDETLAVVAIDLSGRPHAVVDLKVRVRHVGDLQTELVHDFFRRLCCWRARERARQGALRTVEPPPHRSRVQGICTRTAGGVRPRRTARGHAAEYEGAVYESVVVIALIDYGAGNLTSVRKALTALGADFTIPTSDRGVQPGGGLIVPGVGHFAATAALEGEWLQAIKGAVEEWRPSARDLPGHAVAVRGSDEAPDGPGAWRDPRPDHEAAQRSSAPAQNSARRMECAAIPNDSVDGARDSAPPAQRSAFRAPRCTSRTRTPRR
jgi:imidazoleglycerol-phosphate dehydratase